MNETINTLLLRRSIRDYEGKLVDECILNEIMKAGTYAPSARNSQSSIIIHVKDEKVRMKIKELSKIIRGVDAFYNAPHMILVLSRFDSFCPIQDGSLVLGNMMVAAKSLGVGTCWINCLKDILKLPEAKELKDLIDPNDEYIAVGALILGYPKDDKWPDEKAKKEDYIRVI